jgi:hypothetical protein
LTSKGFRINGVSGLTLNGAADCQVTLYDGDDFQGEQHTYHKRDFPDGECKGVWSDRADSIRVSRADAGCSPFSSLMTTRLIHLLLLLRCIF